MVSIHTVAGAANIHNRWRLKGACGGHDEIKFVLGEGKHQQMTFTAECPLINYKLKFYLFRKMNNSTNNKRDTFALLVNITNYVVCDFFTQTYFVVDNFLSSLIKCLLPKKTKRDFTQFQNDFNSHRMSFLLYTHHRGPAYLISIPLLLSLSIGMTKIFPCISFYIFLAIVYIPYIWYKNHYVDKNVERYFAIFERGFRKRLPKWRMYVLAFVVLECIAAYIVMK